MDMRHVCDLSESGYGVATTRRLLKITGLFCKRALQKRLYSAKETYNFKEPTNHSHPILRHVSNLPRSLAAAVTYVNESCRTCE